MPARRPAVRPAPESLTGPATDFHERLWAVMGGESQNAFAKRAGLAQSTLNRVWRGGEPTLTTLIALANAAQVPVGWLAAGEDAQPDSTAKGAVATPAKPVLDHDTLKVVIEEIERHLAAQRKTLTPDKKAELVSLAYSLAAADAEPHQRGNTILRLVKLAG